MSSMSLQVQYVKDFGTAYVDAYEQEPFNLNKVRDTRTLLLSCVCPAFSVKSCKMRLGQTDVA
jgi:hypothetical protein